MKKSKRGHFRPKRTLTAFCICLVDDPDFFSEPSILMVHNIADVDQFDSGEDGLSSTTRKRYTGSGKPKGIGLPGGGQKVEDMESSYETAQNEVLGETGFEVHDIRRLFEDDAKWIITGKDGRTKIITVKTGETPSYDQETARDVTINFVQVFTGTIDWKDSAFRRILKQKKELFSFDQEEREIIEEEIHRVGIWIKFDDLAEHDLESLHIRELNEIDMLGLFPISFLAKMHDNENFKKAFTDFYNYTFYRSHLQRIKRGCEILGIPFEAAD